MDVARNEQGSPEGHGYSRQQIADAVHLAVCEYTQSDGFGHCPVYATCGMTLLMRLGYQHPLIQAGAAWIGSDPDDPDLGAYFDPSNVEAGEFHSWIALTKTKPAEGRSRAPGDMQIIDFSAR